MLSTPSRKVLACLLGGTIGGTFASLRGNQYHVDNIGVVRLYRAGITVFKVGLLYKTSVYDSKLNPNSDEYRQMKSQVHWEGASMLLDLCRANKGVYVKVGQHIGALEYLLPHEYVETMKVLHSHAPTSPLKDVYKVVKDELKANVSEIFTDFDPEPLGAASLAQVHKAKLKDGRTVAVKVQHPYVKGNSFIDLKTMEILVEIVSRVFPEFKFKWLVEESKKNIARELNFKEEAANTLRARFMYSHLPWLKIPEVIEEMCTSRLLTMEFIEGGQVNDLDYIKKHKIDRFEVSEKLGRLYSEMIFSTGFVHSDPHPGNILINKDAAGKVQIVLLDHGLYATVSDKVKTDYSNLWLSILRKDNDGMKQHCAELGVTSLYPLFACMVSGRTWSAINSGLTTTRHSEEEKEEFQRDVPLVLTSITEVLSLVNRELLLILKTNDLLRGIEHTLKTNDRMSSFLVMSRFCVKRVYDDKEVTCSSKVSRYVNIFWKQWDLFKLNVYYVYLSIRTRSLRTFLNTLSFDLA